MAIQKTPYVLNDYTVVLSPFNDLEPGDRYQGAKIRLKISESQYQSYIDYHNYVVKEYNKALRKVYNIQTRVFCANSMSVGIDNGAIIRNEETLIKAKEILFEMRLEIPKKMEEYINRNLIK
jgi:cysteinyl-tRNA synthetase